MIDDLLLEHVVVCDRFCSTLSALFADVLIIASFTSKKCSWDRFG